MKNNIFSGFKTKALAESIGCSYHYLRQIRCGMRKPSIRLAKNIETASGGKIRVLDLLPELADVINGNPAPELNENLG
jgi:DNA-binding transcriptional regulator YdaS (Cro superfamily)